MEVEKRNIQLMIEEIYNSCEVGELFEDRNLLVWFRNDLYHTIHEINKYEKDNFKVK